MPSRSLVDGIYSPTVVFFKDTPKQELDIPTTAAHFEWQAKSGIKGIVVMGTTGEAVALSREERNQITATAREVVDKINPSGLVIVGTVGAQSTLQAIEFCQDAAESGGDYALVLPPGYFAPALSKESILGYYRDVADASPIPILVYSYPGVCSGLDMSSELIAELATHPRIVGVKHTDHNLGKIARLASLKPTFNSEFTVFGGASDYLLAALAVGAQGAITGMANVTPRACVKAMDLWRAGKHDEARELAGAISRGEWALGKGWVTGTKSEGNPSSGFTLYSSENSLTTACFNSFETQPRINYHDPSSAEPWSIINYVPQSLIGTAPSHSYPDNCPIGPPFTAESAQLQATVSAYDANPVACGLVPQASETTEPEDDEEYSSDIERVQDFFCIVPTMDKNIQQNSLPFVLQCYAHWATVRIFDPLKIAHAMRDQVIQHFSLESTRTRTILIANVMNKFAKNLASGSRYMETHFLASAIDRQHAMRVLDNMLEVFTLQTSTLSIRTCLESLEAMAPVFRRACLEPPGYRINLPNILLDPNLNLRHFATLDIMASVTTGQPTYCRYEVPFSIELCEQVYQQQDTIGLQWLHGIPDQFILLFAWIMSLCEIPGTGKNTELVTWIETIVPQINVTTSQSGDPLLHIRRIAVQECWRFAVLIYLYMAFCGASASDPRVARAQRGFMRLVRGVKPSRNPDAFLFIPIALVGIATIDEQDRSTIRQRILGVREHAEPETTGNQTLLMLEDIWARTRNEGRPAVWLDRGIARFRVTGR
ncbi:dihydrodipicolinate synthetase family protein [Rhizoctonia solani]|uniref:Dihydrodipicolinate synthetase family protein n=1 Tax=Rhizoctonia solani TaxID=456999 RepID=A0A8H8STX2_9AGAM|nr:dihydrodipicolinate synthetase family protein [Rhizoctonia solani]QRW16767.1 dihydrodipicolinate synthetase family protein [Rhizoctonia solani]